MGFWELAEAVVPTAARPTGGAEGEKARCPPIRMDISRGDLGKENRRIREKLAWAAAGR